MSKDKNKKSRCPKNYAFSEKEVASISSVSVSYVKKLRSGNVSMKSAKAKRVLEIDQIANENKNLLIQEIQRIVKI
jgi:predicted transcriptional regulator